ncbi:polysaccharide deacetylase family protein [Lederbergia sp. NSJ-179]|uniref:polysaccharide deacetylase family protein n=1 Tax=Lederbergia sp. NSJ-179 TaxID=2931402 RepID=UPI001FD03124|nr:polysaccharide deacetylase family protein [Lederbergia sp. NSJ-179]MCJ7840501.1 polysaccharide deacetylase family protein [Lederbergia sp. NSJ-179]
MAEYISEQDSLNTGRKKINEVLTVSNNNANKAKSDSAEALLKSIASMELSDRTRKELAQAILNGDSSPLGGQLSVGSDGTVYNDPQERLVKEYYKTTSQLVDTDKQRFYESMVNRKEPVGLSYSWVDDDGQIGVYTKLKEIAEEYGVIFTSALITSRIGDDRYMDLTHIKELHETGLFEFMSHTHWHDNNHRPTDMTEEELDYDFRTSQQIIKSLGYNHRGLVLPFAGNNDKIQKVVRRYYDYVIGTGTGLTGRPQYPGELDNYYIRRVSVEYGFDFVKEQLDAAKARGVAWVIFVSHVDQGDWYSDAYVRQIINYTLSLGFNSISTKEGIERYGNIAQFGDNRIGADGSVFGDKIGKVRYMNPNKVNFDTLLNEFQRNTISFTEYSSVNPETAKMPKGRAGVAQTHNYAELAYGYQDYTTSREHRDFRRSWDANNNKWGDFKQINIAQYFGDNGISFDESPLTTKLRDMISWASIRREKAEAEGWPENEPGTVMVNSLRAQDRYPSREYYVYNSDRVYKSVWDSTSSSWAPFKLQPNYIGKLTRTVNTNIPPFSTKNLYIEASSISGSEILQVNANKLLPDGVIYNYYVVNNGQILIRVANLSDQEVVLNGVIFECHRLGI